MSLVFKDHNFPLKPDDYGPDGHKIKNSKITPITTCLWPSFHEYNIYAFQYYLWKILDYSPGGP